MRVAVRGRPGDAAAAADTGADAGTGADADTGADAGTGADTDANPGAGGGLGAEAVVADFAAVFAGLVVRLLVFAGGLDVRFFAAVRFFGAPFVVAFEAFVAFFAALALGGLVVRFFAAFVVAFVVRFTFFAGCFVFVAVRFVVMAPPERGTLSESPPRASSLEPP